MNRLLPFLLALLVADLAVAEATNEHQGRSASIPTATDTPKDLGSLQGIKSILELKVGGKWAIQTNNLWEFVAPVVLPSQIEKGTYVIFASNSNRTAIVQATTWMEQSQAPFYVLGSNTRCVTVTYVSRKHLVSQAIIKTLGLSQPDAVSPMEAMGLRKEGDKKISPSQARSLASQAITGVVQPEAGAPVTVELANGGSEYMVTFETIYEEGVLKGDFTARVRVGSINGNIVGIERAP